MTALAQEIFRAYDIRGIVDVNLTTHAVSTIAQAIAAQVLEQGQREIVVARDGRLSGARLMTVLIAALLQSGCNVIDAGTVPTPLLYFALQELKCQNGVMLTGSHNPAEYNGLKIIIGGVTLSGKHINNLYQRCQEQRFYAGGGRLNTFAITSRYQQAVVENIKLAKPLKIVVDAGNGIVGQIAPAVYRALGCEVSELFCDVDGNFPNHHPDPSVVENLADLRRQVLAEQADVGLAFDGDGDRLGVVTHRGEIIFPDRQMILYAQDVLEHHPQAKIIYDVKCSVNLRYAITAAGGQAIMTKTGHSFVKAELKAQQAKLAGEMSGHIFFADRWFGFDDGIYAGARLLEILSRQDRSAWWQSIPDSINTPEISLPIAEEEKFLFMEKFIHQAEFPKAKRITIDGLRVEYNDGWGLLRASNTTPSLVARFEADNEAALQRIRTAFRQQVQRIAPQLAMAL
jgi:phosphomannomutase / phosphoglucomutase